MQQRKVHIMCSIIIGWCVDIGKDEVQSPNLTVGFHRSRDMLSHSLQRLIVIISDPSMHNLVAHLSALCVFGIIDSNIFLILFLYFRLVHSFEM